jgi:hypothetical protein
VELRAGLDVMERKERFLPLPGIEFLLHRCPARSLVAIPTGLLRLIDEKWSGEEIIRFSPLMIHHCDLINCRFFVLLIPLVPCFVA